MTAVRGSYGRFVRAARVTFADAVRDHQDEVYGVALRILGDRDAAREAASSAFVKAYRSWGRYDQTRPVRHWLLLATQPSFIGGPVFSFGDAPVANATCLSRGKARPHCRSTSTAAPADSA